MIAPAGIYDQELPIAAELARIHDPTVAGGYYLTSLPGLNYKSFRLAAVLGFFPECEHAAPLHRQGQHASGFGKGDGGLDAARGEHGHALARGEHDGGTLGSERR